MKVFDLLLDAIFPKFCLSCGKQTECYVCGKCLEKIRFADVPKCPICEKVTKFGESHLECKGRFGIDGMTVGVDYSEKHVKKIIHEFKYKGITNAAKELVEKFLCPKIGKRKMQESFFARKKIDDYYHVISFVPMHQNKERKRGYNQAEILAKEIARILGLPVFKLLKRVKYNVSQMSLEKKEEREKNVEGIFDFVGAKQRFFPQKLFLLTMWQQQARQFLSARKC